MTLDTTDLRAVLGERAATVTHVPDFAAEAAHLGRRTQRRRVVSSLAGAAVVVAGILGITQLGGNPHRAALPASNFGLETYFGRHEARGGPGGRIVTGLPGSPARDRGPYARLRRREPVLRCADGSGRSQPPGRPRDQHLGQRPEPGRHHGL